MRVREPKWSSGLPEDGMPRGCPLSAEDDARIRALHAEGHGRNAIAKATGFALGTVTKALKRMALPLDREEPRQAVEARRVDLAVRRQALAERLLGDAERLRKQLWTPYRVHQFGGEDGLMTAVLDEPPAGEKLSLIRACGTAIDKSLRLLEVDRDGEMDSARSMLGRLSEAIVGALREDES